MNAQKENKLKLKRYHFDVGNSSTGPVGFCAAILAHTKKEAVEKLLAFLPAEQTVDPCVDDKEERCVYIAVYFNENAITTKDIDDVEEAENA